jgi:hypothetical protein
MHTTQTPVIPPIQLDTMSLAESRDTMTRLSPDRDIEDALLSIVNRWQSDPEHCTPLYDLRTTLELVRKKPRGSERIKGMNTIVRTLGKPDILATFLDMLRSSANRDATLEQELARVSQQGKMHSIYGWCGQTTVVLSSPEPTVGTVPPIEGNVEERLRYPSSLWWISIHIWQPNPNAKGFESGKRREAGVIMEPPHSHPFDFASMLSIGTMRQSIYVPAEPAAPRGEDRYDGVPLEDVDNVWPPHHEQHTVRLKTVEDRITLRPGDSYYMPTHRIHDVEVDIKEALTTPAITVFLASETLVVPHVYMAKSMADYHAEHPDILKLAQPLTPDSWDAKLRATAAYLRGETATLRLDDIVKSESEYAFFHV